MKSLNRSECATTRYPTKAIQFGGGNFLRGFIDWQVHKLNQQADLNVGVTIVRQSNSNSTPILNTQDGLYTSVVRGLNEQGEAVEQLELIDCVNEEISAFTDFDKYMGLAADQNIEFIFSNTTEAGIEFVDTDNLTDAPASAFPAKLTQWLYKRFQTFSGAKDKGLIVIPCELIDYNGEKLKEVVLKYCELWQLEQSFVDWLNASNYFCSTLVDRIVTGFPHDEAETIQTKLGYEDKCLVASEYYHLLAIQTPNNLEKSQLEQVLGLDKADLNILLVDDISPYKKRKVAILNGAHTAMVPLAYMAGLNSVGETMNDALFGKYVNQVLIKEIIPTLDLPADELGQFADDVLKRFQNPYIHHLLISISLNSMAKWQARILPQLLKSIEQTGQVPTLISYALAAQILMYRGIRGDEQIELSDSDKWLSLFNASWGKFAAGESTLKQVVSDVLSADWHWQQDLTQVSGLLSAVADALSQMLEQGVRKALSQVVNK